MSHEGLLTEDASRVDYALKLGLAQKKNKLNYYKRVIQDPRRAVNDPTLRPYAAELLETLLKIVFDDSMIWNRMKLILSRKTKLREEIETLQEKYKPKDTLSTVKRVLKEKRDD